MGKTEKKERSPCRIRRFVLRESPREGFWVRRVLERERERPSGEKNGFHLPPSLTTAPGAASLSNKQGRGENRGLKKRGRTKKEDKRPGTFQAGLPAGRSEKYPNAERFSTESRGGKKDGGKKSGSQSGERVNTGQENFVAFGGRQRHITEGLSRKELQERGNKP